jgi:hypothetical protein
MSADDPEDKLLAALAPFIPGRLIAAKVYFLSTLDSVTLNVGVHCGARTEQVRTKLLVLGRYGIGLPGVEPLTLADAFLVGTE